MKIRKMIGVLLIVVLTISFLGTTPVLAEGDEDKLQGLIADKDLGDKDKDREYIGYPTGWYVVHTNPWR